MSARPYRIPSANALSGPIFAALWLAVSLAAPAAAVRGETFTDNFNATGNPGPATDYNLNAELGTRQGGTLAPMNYTRIAGGANLVQVNNNTPDSYGGESGLGKMEFFNLDFSAVQLGVVPPGHGITLKVEATPVTNNAARNSDNWLCINVGASGGNGFVNGGASGVGMLMRDNGGYQVFNNGPLIADGGVAAAGTYLIEISLNPAGDRYSLTIDGNAVLVDQVVTTTGRLVQFGGIGGAPGPAGQPFFMHTLDNLDIDTQPAPVFACFTASAASGVGPLTVDLDASCSIIQGTVDRYDWDFGDGMAAQGKTAQHTFAPGTYSVLLTVTDTDANSSTAQTTISVLQGRQAYTEDFDRPDGPVDRWTAFTGAWNLLGGRMTTGPSAEERFVWAGDPAISITSRNATYSWDYSFLAPPKPADPAAVGRHGGVMFCASPTTQRADGSFKGYTLDWIDRQVGHGVRLLRWDAGFSAVVGLAVGTPNRSDPPATWRVEIEDQHIRCYGDGELIFDAVDDTYRGGSFGAWTWEGGQEAAVDNVSVVSRPLTGCFTVSPRSTILPESTFQFDAACSEATGGAMITSYEWDFGDGATMNGPSAQHTYIAPDVYTVTLTVTDDRGNTHQTTRAATVTEPLPPFADCFDRPAGPVTGWTPGNGAWSITADGMLQTATAGAEHWVWAGAPARPIAGDFTASADYTFTAVPADGVGRHGGFAFFASRPTTRGDPNFSGYTIDWIDRVDDHGYRLLRVDNAIQVPLAVGTPAIPQPALRWRIEVRGELIRILGDDVPIFEVEDSTYRTGYFGAWTWQNNEDIRIDNVAIPPPTDVPPCELSIACTVIPGAPHILHVEATLQDPELCPQVGCECAEVSITVDGIEAGRSAMPPNLMADFPLPPVLEPGSQHILGIRCAAGDQLGAESTCEFTIPLPPGGGQIPNDCNQDGTADISDAVCILGHLFLGDPPIVPFDPGDPGAMPCGDGTINHPAARALLDANEDGAIDITDPVVLLGFLFLGEPPPLNGTDCKRIEGCQEACQAQ